MARIALIIIAGLAALLAGGALALNASPVGRAFLPSGTGIAAKQLCSLVFVSGLEPDRARELYIDPLLTDARGMVSMKADLDAKTASASVFGLWRHEAVHREGLGCTLTHGYDGFDPDLAVPFETAPDDFDLDDVHREAAFDADALDAAVDRAFGDGRNTLAVLIMQDGRLVAERYAEDIDRSTRLHGWSMTKSMMATLAGVLESQGRIDADESGNIPALADREGGDEASIALSLRMTGGLDAAELNTGFDPNSRMLFTAPDMVAFAASRDRLHPPGAHWQYMSADYVLAADAMMRTLGEDVEGRTRALRAELFEPLGISDAVLEPDAAGNHQAAAYLFARPHDWLRMGLAYLQDGQGADGQAVFDPGWRQVATTPTPGSQGVYGMGFWLPGEDSVLPEGTFFANGFQGQSLYIVPERDLLVLRMGADLAPVGTGGLTHDVIEAMRGD